MTQATREVLVAARALIDTPEKWCKGSWARTAKRGGRPCAATDTQARCRCLSAAVLMSAATVESKVAVKRALYGAIDDMRLRRYQHARLEEFNDHPRTTHADVLALFDAAIAAQPDAEVGT